MSSLYTIKLYRLQIYLHSNKWLRKLIMVITWIVSFGVGVIQSGSTNREWIRTSKTKEIALFAIELIILNAFIWAWMVVSCVKTITREKLTLTDSTTPAPPIKTILFMIINDSCRKIQNWGYL